MLGRPGPSLRAVTPKPLGAINCAPAMVVRLSRASFCEALLSLESRSLVSRRWRQESTWEGWNGFFDVASFCNSRIVRVAPTEPHYNTPAQEVPQSTDVGSGVTLALPHRGDAGPPSVPPYTFPDTHSPPLTGLSLEARLRSRLLHPPGPGAESFQVLLFPLYAARSNP